MQTRPLARMCYGQIDRVRLGGGRRTMVNLGVVESGNDSYRTLSVGPAAAMLAAIRQRLEVRDIAFQDEIDGFLSLDGVRQRKRNSASKTG